MEAGQREEGRGEQVGADGHALGVQARVLGHLADQEDRAERDRRQPASAEAALIVARAAAARPATMVRAAGEQDQAEAAPCAARRGRCGPKPPARAMRYSRKATISAPKKTLSEEMKAHDAEHGSASRTKPRSRRRRVSAAGCTARAARRACCEVPQRPVRCRSAAARLKFCGGGGEVVAHSSVQASHGLSPAALGRAAGCGTMFQQQHQHADAPSGTRRSVSSEVQRAPAGQVRVGVDPARHAHQPEDVHREERQVEADHHQPEVPSARAARRAGGRSSWGTSSRSPARMREQRAAEQHVVEVGDDVVGVGGLPVDRHRREVDAGHAADR